MPRKKKTADGSFEAEADFQMYAMPNARPVKQTYQSELAQGGSPQHSLLHKSPAEQQNAPIDDSNLAAHFPSAVNPDVIEHESRNSARSPDDHSPFSDISPSPVEPLDNDVMTRSTMSNGSGKGVYTMTGTMKRGKKGRDVVEVQVELTENEVKKLQRSTVLEDDKSNDCLCGRLKGPHILLFTVLFIPFALIATACVVFYVGTMCWYNIYLFLSEEKSIWHRIFLCPLLLLFYPFLIVFSVVGIGLYAAVIQVSWWFSSWHKEIRDFDKGFFGLFCNKLGVPQCAPYEVVVIDDQPPRTAQQSTQVVESNV